VRSKEAPPAGEIERLQEALGDRWALERELGHGLTSTVYLARDLKHHRRVAVKVLRPELAVSLGRERFHREIEIAASLSHPHILPLFSSGEANGQLYYVMPYVEGESLEDRMAREGPFPVGEALRIAREVAAALAYAHQHGVVHRDIKPANVMLSAGEAVVADFGIAKAITDAGHEKLTQTGIAIGSPVYMSPEQATGERELDGRSDIYSLGCVVYEMLTGEPPVMGNTPTEVLSHRLMDDVLPLTSHVKGVPPEVEEVIETALARDRNDRYPSAEAFAEALESTGSTLPGPALSAAPKRKKAFWAELQRRKVYSTAILYAVVAWVTVEVTDTTFPHLGLEAAVPAIVLLAVIGFPVALGFAWAFEVSREGNRRTQPVTVAPANRTSLWVSGVAILALFVVIGAGIRVSSAWRTGSDAGADASGADTPPTYAAGATGGPVAASPMAAPTHIAVLPFEDVSAGGELDHLGGAFARTLIDDLTQVKALRIVSFNGVRPYRHSSLTPDSIGLALAVGTLVAGTVDESEGRLRVHVSLIDAETGMNLASRTLHRPREETFQLQDDLAFEVSGFLRERLGDEVRLRDRRAATANMAAWESVQQAEYLWEDVQPLFKAGDRDEASAMLIRIDAILARAESLDPTWVEPIILRGWVAAKQASLAAEEGKWDRDWVDRGISDAERALDLRPDGAKALELRGSLRYRLWFATESSPLSELLAGAERDLRAAVALDPMRARAWGYLSLLLLQARAEFAEAKTAARRAYEADPFLEEASDVLMRLVQASVDLEEYEEARRWAAEGSRRFPGNVDFAASELIFLTQTPPMAGDADRAWALAEKILALTPPTRREEHMPMGRMQVAIVIARAGLADSARSVIERTRNKAGQQARVLSAYEEAAAWLAIGEEDECLEALALHVEANPQERTYVSSDSWFEALWNDPRFQELVSTTG
jgi:TolB-like protein/tRNA A-37 threonylcarbamoyl transferase component Bud32